MAEAITSLDNPDDEVITVSCAELGVKIEWESPRYEEGTPNDHGVHRVIDTEESEQMADACLAAIGWLREYDRKRIVNNRDLILLETDAYIYMLKVREHGEIFDIIQKGGDDRLESRWSLFDYYDAESGFLFADISDTIEFVSGLSNACTVYCRIIRTPKEGAA